MTHTVELYSTIACAKCGHIEKYQMPLYAKRTFYRCSSCGLELRTRAGECCIYCSYGSVGCPSRQKPGETATVQPGGG